MVQNLTTLASVRSWLGTQAQSSTSTNDVLLSSLIVRASTFLIGQLARPSLAMMLYTDLVDGYGGDSLMLRQWPVKSVVSVNFSGISVTQQATGNPPQNGYLVDSPDSAQGQQFLRLYGYCFPRGKRCVSVSYWAGYEILSEAQSVPSSGNLQITTDFTWLGDSGVTYASSGLSLTSVPLGSALSTGQYSVNPDTGQYTFSSGDAGAAVLISYSYVPSDMQQACDELVGERYSYMSRIGIVSKSLNGQETASFSQKDMSDFIKSSIQQYRRVTMA